MGEKSECKIKTTKIKNKRFQIANYQVSNYCSVFAARKLKYSFDYGK